MGSALEHLDQAVDHLDRAFSALDPGVQKLIGVVLVLLVVCGCCGLGNMGSDDACEDEFKLLRTITPTSSTQPSAWCDNGAVMTVRDVEGGFAVECHCPAPLPLVEASFHVEGEEGGS
jgi:hypothetical protein